MIIWAFSKVCKAGDSLRFIACMHCHRRVCSNRTGSLVNSVVIQVEFLVAFVLLKVIVVLKNWHCAFQRQSVRIVAIQWRGRNPFADYKIVRRRSCGRGRGEERAEWPILARAAISRGIWRIGCVISANAHLSTGGMDWLSFFLLLEKFVTTRIN